MAKYNSAIYKLNINTYVFKEYLIGIMIYGEFALGNPSPKVPSFRNINFDDSSSCQVQFLDMFRTHIGQFEYFFVNFQNSSPHRATI